MRDEDLQDGAGCPIAVNDEDALSRIGPASKPRRSFRQGEEAGPHYFFPFARSWASRICWIRIGVTPIALAIQTFPLVSEALAINRARSEVASS